MASRRPHLLMIAVLLTAGSTAFADAPATVAPPPATAAPVTATTAAPSAPLTSDTPAPSTASNALTITGPGGATLRCKEQAAQTFLIRGNWFRGDPMAGRKMLEDAIKYRTQQYGFFEGFGQSSWNHHPPRFYAKTTTFMGLPIQVNEKIIPAIKCVEVALKANGADAEYHPKTAGGIRFTNTYRGFEVSNHVYGIAIDIEPDKNSCCGCVAPWPNHPLCKNKSLTVYQRMAMPKSWVDTFERFGFYWLGHDTLQDTMHFEFLGDPDKIVETVTP